MMGSPNDAGYALLMCYLYKLLKNFQDLFSDLQRKEHINIALAYRTLNVFENMH